MLLIPLVLATPVFEDSTIVYDADDNWNKGAQVGLEVNVTSRNFYLYNITVATGVTAVNCTIFLNTSILSDIPVNTTPIVSGVCQYGTLGLHLNFSTVYRIGVSTDATQNVRRKLAVSFPIIGTNIDWKYGYYPSGVFVRQNAGRGIQSLWGENIGGSLPKITLINLTSEDGNGQIIFNETAEELGKLSGLAKTNDSTPTVKAITDISATCAFVDDNKNFNYTDAIVYNPNSICSTTGGTSHTCSYFRQPNNRLKEFFDWL